MTYFIVSLIWWFFLSSCIISAGYHRYFAHNTFKAPVWYEYLVLILGPLSGAGNILGWAGVHRLHHNYSDTRHDPHSPHFTPVWQVITSTFKVPPIKRMHLKDLMRNKRIMWFYKNHHYIWYTYFFMLAFIPFTWWVVFFITPMIYGYIGYGFLNWWCHSGEEVKNSALANILTGGEGWHMNHHKRPHSWRIGLEWWQWDPAAWFIVLIKK